MYVAKSDGVQPYQILLPIVVKTAIVPLVRPDEKTATTTPQLQIITGYRNSK